MIEPFLDRPARLGWRKNFTQIIFDPDQPYVEFSLTPEFPWCSEELAKRGIVWSLRDLLASVRTPGAYQLVTCTCGYAPDAGLEERICVSHPDAESVVWEIDIKGLAPALADTLANIEGFICLRFVRDEYEVDIRAMLREVQETAYKPVSLAQMAAANGIEYLRSEYPACLSLPAEVFEPGERGCDLEDFVVMDCEAPWGRKPVLRAGRLLEIGLFDDWLARVDGNVDKDWIGRWFTRWVTLAAFRTWDAYFFRRYGLNGVLLEADEVRPNGIVMSFNDALEACHVAGEHLAAAIQAQFDEGETAPGLVVRYVRFAPPMVQMENQR